MGDMVAIIYTDGQLDFAAIRDECRDGKWVPVLAVKPKDDPDAEGTIFLFHRFADAQKFIVLNLREGKYKDWIPGVLTLPAEDVVNICKKHKVEFQSYARRMTTHPTLDMSFEVIEVGETPTLYVANADKDLRAKAGMT